MYQVAGLDMYQLSSPWIPLRILLSSMLLMEARCQRVQGNAVDYAAECKWSRVMKQSGIASNELDIVVWIDAIVV